MQRNNQMVEHHHASLHTIEEGLLLSNSGYRSDTNINCTIFHYHLEHKYNHRTRVPLNI